MSSEADGLRLADMLDRAERILHYVEGLSESDLLYNRLLQDGVLHNFLILGEAAAQISQPTRERYPGLPWRQMIGIRNYIVHGYTRIDLGIIWKTIQEDVPGSVSALLTILPPEQT